MIRFVKKTEPGYFGEAVPPVCMVCLTAFLWAAVILFPAKAVGKTLRVEANAGQPGLQAILSSARAGDTIVLTSGVYSGDLEISVPLSLIGEGSPVIRGSGKGSVITLNANGCTIKGLVIEHSGGDLQSEDSGILLRSSDNIVIGNKLQDILFGIYLMRSSGNVISRNEITGRRELEAGERGAGLHLWDSSNNLLEENIISYARDGMYIQSSSGNTARRNSVSNLRYGLHYMSSDDNSFEGNLFTGNIAGAAIMYSRRIQLRGNSFLRNRGFSSFGILFQDCDDITVENNFIIDNTCGVFLEALRKGSFAHNVIADNDVAMEVFGSADQCVFRQNNYVENLSPLLLVGSGTNTRWESNYWSDYDGYDLDENGQGDNPHKIQNIFEYLEANYPRLRIYLSSPAAQALANAEKAFPIIHTADVRDPSPAIRPYQLNYPFRVETTRPASRLVFGIIAFVVCISAMAALLKRGIK